MFRSMPDTALADRRQRDCCWRYARFGAAGGWHVVAWGDDYFGQCRVPARLTKVKAIAAGKATVWR
jgi:hypothetical protein